MATRSQELAPNRRTCGGKAPGSVGATASTHWTGTQTICMSECTSMPAALGLRMAMTGAGWRDGRNLFGLSLSGLALAHGADYLVRMNGNKAGVGQEGTGGMQFPQRD